MHGFRHPSPYDILLLLGVAIIVDRRHVLAASKSERLLTGARFCKAKRNIPERQRYP
jgi:hypothetical protein